MFVASRFSKCMFLKIIIFHSFHKGFCIGFSFGVRAFDGVPVLAFVTVCVFLCFCFLSFRVCVAIYSVFIFLVFFFVLGYWISLSRLVVVKWCGCACIRNCLCIFMLLIFVF